MKNKKYQPYIYWGITGFVVLSLLIALIFFIIEMEKVKATVQMFFGILSPITYGAVLAYLLAPIYNWVRDLTVSGLKKSSLSQKNQEALGSSLATFFSVAVLIAVVVGLASMLIPQLRDSIVGIIEALPTSIYNLQLRLEQILADDPDLEMIVMEYYDMGVFQLQTWLNNDVIPNMDKIYSFISGLSSGIFTVINVLKNILIGIIVMVYLLNMKEKLLTQLKMILYGAFPLKIANKVLEEGRYVHQVFGGFIIGKLLDSLIIGILCFVLLNFMKMPYVLLISVIVGVTNVIPFFGPFIGAIPSAFLILLVSPVKCFWFLGFILLLQQFDGNILGPKILGDSTGLSSFWVLFSILLFGGWFGFVGMIIGVPTFAVFYRLVTELVTWLLAKRQLSTDIEKYDGLNYIDEENKAYIEK
ncbi:AI-2E family transporter [Clostridiaceae bacterium]|nr:AI-2E family transporter [Clostridiaceae bacterium]